MIDYQLIADSVRYYNEVGFQQIETPWTVTEAISNITKPSWVKNFKIEGKDKCLVGSAEQGFLYLYLKGFLPKGKFQSVSPCFRDEIFGPWHSKYFIKNELIITDGQIFNMERVMDVVEKARAFFERYLGKVKIINISESQVDLEYKGIELGSYGLRTCEFLTYIYGTGAAEPRLSSVIKRYGIPH